VLVLVKGMFSGLTRRFTPFRNSKVSGIVGDCRGSSGATVATLGRFGGRSCHRLATDQSDFPTQDVLTRGIQCAIINT
jgi:hypothetical protein